MPNEEVLKCVNDSFQAFTEVKLIYYTIDNVTEKDENGNEHITKRINYYLVCDLDNNKDNSPLMLHYGIQRKYIEAAIRKEADTSANLDINFTLVSLRDFKNSDEETRQKYNSDLSRGHITFIRDEELKPSKGRK